MILLTGGSGWVGSAVARRLHQRGVPIVLLARGDAARARIAARVGAEVPVLEGDVTRPGVADAAAVARLRGRIAQVVHLAAVVRLEAEAKDEIDRVNLGGTEAVLALAERLGAERFTHMSTCAVSGDAEAFDEADFDVGQHFRNPYEHSKHRAEARVRAWRGAWTVLRMPAMVGAAGDGVATDFSGAIYRVAAAYWLVVQALDEALREGLGGELEREGCFRQAGRWHLPEHVPWHPDTPCEVVTEDWLADAVVAAVTRPVSGTLHLVHPSPPRAREVFPVVLDALGVHPTPTFGATGPRESPENRGRIPVDEEEPLTDGPWRRLVRRTLDRVAGLHYPYLRHIARLGRTRLAELDLRAAPPLDEALWRRLVAHAVEREFSS